MKEIIENLIGFDLSTLFAADAIFAVGGGFMTGGGTTSLNMVARRA